MNIILAVFVIIVQPSLAAIPCIMVNTSLPPGSDTINTSCTSVVFANVTAQGNMMINLSIGAMVQANPAAENITVTLRDLSLLDGAVLVIEGSSPYGAGGGGGGGASSTVPKISILVQSLVGSDGALVFIGSFPGGVSILVSDANMTASSVSAPRLDQFDLLNPAYAKVVMLVNLSLTNNASYVVQRSAFDATASSNGIPMYINGGLKVANDSRLAFIHCNWTSPSSLASPNTYAVRMEYAPASISSSSQWTLTSCRWRETT